MGLANAGGCQAWQSMSTVALTDVATAEGCQSRQLLQPFKQSVWRQDVTAYAYHGRPSEPCTSLLL